MKKIPSFLTFLLHVYKTFELFITKAKSVYKTLLTRYFQRKIYNQQKVFRQKQFLKHLGNYEKEAVAPKEKELSVTGPYCSIIYGFS